MRKNIVAKHEILLFRPQGIDQKQDHFPNSLKCSAYFFGSILEKKEAIDAYAQFWQKPYEMLDAKELLLRVRAMKFVLGIKTTDV